MSDFVNDFWSVYISAISIAGIVWVLYLLLSQNKIKIQKKSDGKVSDTGHVWDEDLRELNNPLPRWWFWLFILTTVFAVVYLALYPGLGAYKGALGFSSTGEHDRDRAAMEAQAKTIYANYMGKDPKEIAKDPKALEIGQRLFLNHCAQCHSSDGGGSKGYPNLTDGDWLGGAGDSDYIKTTILKGRTGVMPAFEKQLDAGQITEIAHYVRALSGLASDDIKAANGRDLFKTNCAACHGGNGAGNTAVGAPNLTDKVWLYGSSEATIVESITKGRTNQMPAHESILTPEKVQMLSAYVWNLSHSGNPDIKK